MATPVDSFEVKNYAVLTELLDYRTDKIIDSLGIFGTDKFHTSTVAEVQRKTRSLDNIVAQPRRGERNFAGRDKVIKRNFDVPFFPLDTEFSAAEVQDLKKFGSVDEPQDMNSVVSDVLTRINGSHARLQTKSRYQALKGYSYSPNWTQGQYDYATEFGVTRPTDVAITFYDESLDPALQLETVRHTIIDNAGDDGDNYRLIALASRTYFAELISHEMIRDAWRSYKSGDEPLRKRLNGDANNRYFEYGGILFIEDFSKEIEEGSAYVFPRGVADMFATVYAPADHKDYANKEAEKIYTFIEDKGRYETVETETSFIVVNTRPELVVKLTIDEEPVSEVEVEVG